MCPDFKALELWDWVRERVFQRYGIRGTESVALLRLRFSQGRSLYARASTQFTLGWALATLGEQSGRNEPSKEAVTAFRVALEEQTRECVPLDWARTQTNLGLALATLGEGTGQPHLLKEALEAITAAREIYRDAGMVQYEAAFAERIKALNAAIADLEKR